MISTDIRLTLRKSDYSDDWYVIERGEHDWREWLERTEPNVSRYMTSARFSDADVEGDGEQMLALAGAIESRTRESFKRCAVRCDGGLAFFSSPRNSQTEGCTNYEHALALALEIRSTLAGKGGAK